MSESTAAGSPAVVHIVSHGPHCLDGVAAAAAIARFYRGTEVHPQFAGNPYIDEMLQELNPQGRLDEQELWITDISWTDPATDAHLRKLAAAGLKIFWIDHHRTAIQRLESGKIDVPFTHKIIDDSVAAAKLTFDYLQGRVRQSGMRQEALDSFGRVVAMADDNDRWIHEIDGSWDLALTLRSMDGAEAFDDLVAIDEHVTYTPRMQAAFDKVDGDLRRSLELATSSRTENQNDDGVTIVAAVCNGYPSEIGDRWGRALPNAVFAFFDLKSGAISYRRSPDCQVDLSQVAATFGGGGHPAAAGSEIPELVTRLAQGVADRVTDAVRVVSEE